MAWLLCVVIAVSLVACGGGRQKTHYDAAPCPEPNFPGVPQAELGANYSCGYLTAPENRLDPQSRTIRLLVARVKAVSDKPKADPIVYLAGGPGGAATLSAPRVVAGGLNADRDVIFVNQRGTLHSDPHLSCPEMDDFAVRALDLDFEAPATADLDAAAVTACRNRLVAEGFHLASYSSRENAADIAALRKQLGIEKWNVYGVSYGSDLAQQLLRTHREGIRSMVLDSVVPTSFNLIDRWWQAPASGLAAIIGACNDQPGCAQAYPDLATVFVNVVSTLSRQPLKVSTSDANGDPVQVTIDGFKVVPLALSWSADPAKVTDIPRMIFALARGEGRLAAAGIAETVPPPEQRGLLGAGLALGTYCQEMANWTTPEQALSRARTAIPGLPDSVLRITPTGSWIFRECAAWGLGRSDTADRMSVSSGVPTLILSGTFDSSTAPQWAEEITPGLGNSQLVRFPGVGHGVLPNSACAQSIVTAFVDDPSRDIDKSCVWKMTMPTFSLPEPAR